MSSNRRVRYIAAPAATFVTLSSTGLVVALAGSAQAAEAVPVAAGVQTAAAPATAATSTAPVAVVVVVPARPAAAPAVTPAVVSPAVAVAPVVVAPVRAPAAAPVTSPPVATPAVAPASPAAAAPVAAPAPRTASVVAPSAPVATARAVVPLVTPRQLNELTPTAVLHTAENYAVLAGSGITNTLVTHVGGDVGSAPTGSETGLGSFVFDSGVNHPAPPDAATVQATNDLTTAYNNLGLLAGSTIGSELGGQSLGAGVYDATAGFNITGTLTLAGPGVFVFRTPGQLNTLVGSNVVLTGGALACNVYFRAGLDATSANLLGNLQGTVLAYNTITVGSGVTVTGRLLAGAQASHNGAVTLIGDTIKNPGSCAAGTTGGGNTPPSSPTIPTGGTTGTGTTVTGGSGTPAGTTVTGGSGTPSGTARTPNGTSGTPTGLTGRPVSFVVHNATGSHIIHGVLVSGSTTATGTGTDTTMATPRGGTELTATPSGAQVGQVPVGGVHAGDGSSLAVAGTGTRTAAADPLLLEALALAGIAGTAGVVARLRRRRG